MGLFDAFGVGGGSLSLQLQFPQTQAGAVVQGVAVFQGGRRAQQITHVTVTVRQTLQVVDPNNPSQLRQESRELVPAMRVAGAFTAQAGQAYQLPFQFQVPHDAWGSDPKFVSYRVSASADIDGEIDPGAGVELQVQGPAYGVHPAMGAMAPMGPPQYAQPQYDKGYDAKAAAAKAAAAKGHDPYGNPHDPYGKQQQHDPYGKQQQHDPYGKQQHDPYANPDDPYGKKGHDPKGGKY